MNTKKLVRGEAVMLTKKSAEKNGLVGQIGVVLGTARDGGKPYVVIGWGRGVKDKSGASGSGYRLSEVKRAAKK